MPSLSINERITTGYGWTDSPVLIYPSATQTAYINRIIDSRKTSGDPRASGDTEDIMEMLNDEKVLTQDERWRYVVPEELVKVETDNDSEFAIRILSCESLRYAPVQRSAAPIPDNSDLISQYTKERASRYLALANRINELRKLSELHYRHVHKVTYVYEDHAGYALGGANPGIGGYVNPREYVGAVTSVAQLEQAELIKRGSTFIDYTLPPKFSDDRGFSPSNFTGIKLHNPNKATKYQVPILNRVFPDLGVSWLQDFGDVSQLDINANWDAEVRDIKPTSVRADHINELRKALSAYAAHTHEVAMQMIDLRAIDARTNANYNVNPTGIAFSINPGYTDVKPPRYLTAIGACLDDATGFGAFSNVSILGLEVPLLSHVYYNGKTDENGDLLEGISGIRIYNNFQLRTYADEIYPEYGIGAPEAVPEQTLMTAHVKPARNLLLHASANDFTTNLMHSKYPGESVKKAADVSGAVPDIMKPIDTNPSDPFDLIQLSDTGINRVSPPSDLDAYGHGTGATIAGDITEKVIAYESDGNLGNRGRIKIVFSPVNVNQLNLSSDRHMYYETVSDRRAVLFSHGNDDCSGIPWSPAACKELPKMKYSHPDIDGSLLIGSDHHMNIFCMVPDNDHHFKRKVFNAVNSMPFTSRIDQSSRSPSFDKYTDQYIRWNKHKLSGNRHPQGINKDSEKENVRATYSGGSSRGDGAPTRGLLDDADPAGDDFFFRQAGNPVTKTPDEVQESMSNLIEVWIEASKFRKFKDFPDKDTYTIHASIMDIRGGMIMHLCGDVLITDADSTGLFEVDLSYDLRPGKTSSLSAGFSSLTETTIIPVTLLSFSSINNRVAVQDGFELKVDDQLNVVGTPSNDGVYAIRRIDGDNIYLHSSTGASLITETLGPPVVVDAYRYSQDNKTEVLCETESGNPTRQDSMPGISQYTMTNASYAEASHLGNENGNFPFLYHQYRDIRELLDSNHAPSHYECFRELERVLQSKDASKIEDRLIMARYTYKSPSSQMPGLYRSSEVAPSGDFFADSKISDFDIFDQDENMVDSTSTNFKSVYVLGNSLCALNHVQYAELTVPYPTFDRDRIFIRPIHIPVTDIFAAVETKAKMNTSRYSELTGLRPIFSYENTSLPPTNGFFSTMSVDVKGARIKKDDLVAIIFSDVFESRARKREYRVYDLENITGNAHDMTIDAQRLWLIDTTAGANTLDMSDEIDELLAISPQDEFENSRFKEMKPGLLFVVNDEIKYHRPTCPLRADDLHYARHFIFKSIFVSTNPVDGFDREVFTSTYKTLPTGRSTKATKSGVAIIVTPDGNLDNLYNNMGRSPLLAHLNTVENDGGSGSYASARLVHTRTETKKADGGSSIISSFSNGVYSADGYNIKQLKGTIRNVNTGAKVEDGDPIKAVDVNELYEGMEWVRNHTHTFEFIHRSDQPIYVEDTP